MSTPTAPVAPSIPGHPPALDRWAVARALVSLQAILFLAVSIEALVTNAIMGGVSGIPPAALTASVALVTLVTAVGLGRRSRWARRWTVVAEIGLAALAIIDLVIALLLGGDVPLLLPVTRLALPIAVLVVLRGARVAA